MPSLAEAVVADLLEKAHLAAADTVNVALGQIYEKSQQRVPRSMEHETEVARHRTEAGYPERSLAESGEVIPATPQDLNGMVIYNSEYAAAQEVGEMVYDSRRAGRPVTWHAGSYTTPGTGPRYLDTSVKEVLAELPTELEIQSQIQFGVPPGALGRR